MGSYTHADAEVIAATGDDPDSTPDNGDASEDDYDWAVVATATARVYADVLD